MKLLGQIVFTITVIFVLSVISAIPLAGIIFAGLHSWWWLLLVVPLIFAAWFAIYYVLMEFFWLLDTWY